MKTEKKNGVTVFKCGKKHDKPVKPKKNKQEAATASEIIMEENNYGD
jgi:hypothetical protein